VTNETTPVDPAVEYPNRRGLNDSEPASGHLSGQLKDPLEDPVQTLDSDSGVLESDDVLDSDSEDELEEVRHLPSRGRVLRRQRLGLLGSLVGYAFLGWALQDFGTAPLVWLVLGSGAALWGFDRARQWHLLLPALVSALALVSIVLPIWVLGLLSIPILGVFGCALMMKQQTPEAALMSGLFVYGLSVAAASLGAIVLGLMGGDAPEIALGVVRVLVGFLFLSLLPAMHRRRFYGLRSLKTWQRLSVRYGQFLGMSLIGLAAGAGLNFVDWNGSLAWIMRSLS
jgi:hypothetical protein